MAELKDTEKQEIIEKPTIDDDNEEDKELMNSLAEALKTPQTEHILSDKYIERVSDPEFQKILPALDCHQVHHGIYMGNGLTAKNKKFLRICRITHVINVAEGRGKGFVNTNSEFYSDYSIKYLGIPVADSPTVDMRQYFHIANEFIESALANYGHVFVHCFMGISRSATIIIAYMMIRCNMSAARAIHLLRRRRRIHPNPGFIRQLAILDKELRGRDIKCMRCICI